MTINDTDNWVDRLAQSIPMGNAIVAPNRRPSYALIAVDSDPTAEIGKEGTGSQNVCVRELGLGLARRGCQVDIFTRREHPEQEEIVEIAPGCRTIRLTAGPAAFIPRDELFPHLPAFIDAWWVFQLRSGRNYTLIHSNYWLSGWVGLQLKSQLRIPQVHTYHSIGVVKYHGMPQPPAIAVTRHLVETECLTSTDCVISTTPQEVADLRQLISDRGRVRVIPCAVNTTQFGSISRTVARAHLQIATDEKSILYVGRFDRRKGIETLIKACATLTKPVRLYLVGGDRTSREQYQERQRIQALITELGLKDVTVFVGQVAQTELPFYYAAANVCVIPSNYEPFGLVALEAMAAGTPVIASIVGGLKHTVIHRETGMLIPPNEPTALATAITEVFDHPWQWEAYGRAGRQWVRDNFSAAGVSAEIHSLYQSLTLNESVRAAYDTQKLNPSLKLVSRFIE